MSSLTFFPDDDKMDTLIATLTTLAAAMDTTAAKMADLATVIAKLTVAMARVQVPLSLLFAASTVCLFTLAFCIIFMVRVEAMINSRVQMCMARYVVSTAL